MLENLNPAPKVEAPNDFRPALEFDGEELTATLPNGRTDWQEFLKEQGFDPDEFELIGAPRVSRWQKYDGDWLSAYKFRLQKRTEFDTDLPLLWKTAKTNSRKGKPVTPNSEKAFVIMLSDFQLGKTDHRGNHEQSVTHILDSYLRIENKVKQLKPERIVIAELGDIVEGFSNKADMQQLRTNSLSIMQQVDLALTLIWDLVKRLNKYCDNLTFATVASNHCQFRINKQQVGLPGQDDWGVFIAKQVHKLSEETGVSVRVLIPEPSDESLALDVFGDQFHVLGLWHGHQSPRPEQVPDFWTKQAFGRQPIHAASIGLTGHFHHLRVQELGAHANGGSRYWIQAKTMDTGSNWWRLNSGSESTPGIVCFELDSKKHFTGSVIVL